MLQFIKSFFRTTASSSRKVSAARRFRPMLEELETREVPAAFTYTYDWNGPEGGIWSKQTNWTITPPLAGPAATKSLYR